MKGRLLGLRHLGHLAEHLAGCRKVEPAAGRAVAKRRKHMMRPVNIGIQR